MRKQIITLNDPKLSRREFLRLAGISAIAAGVGYGAGAIGWRSQPPSLSLQAFIPADEDLAASLLNAFVSLGTPHHYSSAAGVDRWAEMMRYPISSGQYPAAGGKLTIQTSQLDKPVPSDLLLSDSRVSIYDPERDFNAEFVNLRKQLRDLSADLNLKAIFTGQERPSDGRTFAIISDHRGLYDQIPLSRNYDSITIDGPVGKTSVRILDGKLWIHNASCRQHLCQKASPLAVTGDRTVCAPNRLLIEIRSG